jgi:TonB-dependent starch-binding outer membrane protein SusC
MLLSPSIASEAGYQESPEENAGSVNNTGFEAELNWKQDFSGFGVNVSTNVSHYHNEVTSLGSDGQPIYDAGVRSKGSVTKTAVGHAIGEFYGRVTDGLFQSQDEINSYTDGSGNLL